MNQEKFVNTYIDLLNTTLSEAVQKNIVAQAQKKVFEEDLNDLNELLSAKDKNLKELFDKKEEQIRNLTNELNDARRQAGSMSSQLEESRTAAQHFETYKNELINCRKRNEELVELINQKDKLILQKDEELKKFNAAPEPVVVNKLGKKNNPPPLEKPEPETVVTDKSKTVKVKPVKDAGTF